MNNDNQYTVSERRNALSIISKLCSAAVASLRVCFDNSARRQKNQSRIPEDQPTSEIDLLRAPCNPLRKYHEQRKFTH